jgi:fatty-acyl-CoA synthase
MATIREVRLTESYWPADTSRELLDVTLGGLLRHGAAEVPDRVALVEGVPDPATRRRWTYSELLADAERVARALLGRFEPGERVAVYAANCAEWVLL